MDRWDGYNGHTRGIRLDEGLCVDKEDRYNGHTRGIRLDTRGFVCVWIKRTDITGIQGVSG